MGYLSVPGVPGICMLPVWSAMRLFLQIALWYCLRVRLVACCGFQGFQGLPLTAPMLFTLILDTCLSSPSLVKSTSPSLQLPCLTSSPLLRCLVSTSDGFSFPSILPTMTCLDFTSSWIYMCATAMCLIFPAPIFLDACNAADE